MPNFCVTTINVPKMRVPKLCVKHCLRTKMFCDMVVHERRCVSKLRVTTKACVKDGAWQHLVRDEEACVKDGV